MTAMSVKLNTQTWPNLLAKVTEDNKNRVDFNTTFRDLQVMPNLEDGTESPLLVFSHGDKSDSGLMSERAYRQYLSKLSIPHRVATLFSGDLQDRMICERIRDEACSPDAEIFLRTRTNEAGNVSRIRGLLSGRYGDIRDLEIAEIMNDLMPSLSGYGVLRGIVTDELFSLTLLGNDPVHSNGDQYYPVHVVRNSEVGAASFNVTSGICKGACSNGMLFGFRSDCRFRIRHLGKKMRENVGVALNKALGNVDKWKETVAPAISRAKEIRIDLSDDKQKAKAVKDLRDRGLTKKLSVKVLDFSRSLPTEVYGSEFLGDANQMVSRWAIVNSLTHLAQDTTTYSEFQRYEIEAAAGALLLSRVA